MKVEGNTVTVYYTFRNMAQAPEVETYSFTLQPEGGELKPGESHRTSWQTNFLPTMTDIQYWDGKAWDQWDVQYPQNPYDNYDFESQEAASYRFRLVAYIGNNAVATSNEFTVTWKNGAGKIAAGHSGTAEWTKTATAHTKKYTCCQKAVVAQEAHEWNNGICAECMYMCPHTADSNKDHKCDACGIDMGTHEAAVGKHTCDYCGKTVTECSDKNSDGKCDVCGINLGTETRPAETTAKETEPAVTTAKETEPSETTAEATEPEQTSAQITEPEETRSPVTEADTTAEAPEENGCGSTVSLAGIVLIVALGVCATVAVKKKESEAC